MIRSIPKVKFFAWIFILGVHSTVPFVASGFHSDIPDENAYRNLAENVGSGKGFHVDFSAFWHAPRQPYTYVAPGWPGLLAAGYFAAGDLGFWTVMAVVWCINAILIYELGQTLSLPTGWCWALTLWLTVYPLYLFYHGHLMSEPLTIAFCLGITILGVKWLNQQTWCLLASLAVVSGLGHLVRSLLILPICAVWLVAPFFVPWRRLLPQTATLVCIHVLVLTPWLWRMNTVGAGFYSTELKLGVNLYQYNGAPVDDAYDMNAKQDLGYPPNLHQLSPRERNALLTKMAIQGILDNPGRYLERCGQRVGLLLSPVPRFYQVSHLQYVAVLLSTVFFFYPFLAAIMVRLVIPRKLAAAEWALLLSVLLWYAFHIAIHASIRLRLPSDVWCAALAVSLWVPRPMTTGSDPKAIGLAPRTA